MLIDSPRITIPDRQHWQRLQKYDATFASTLPLDVMAERAHRVIADFAEAGPCYASTSWGKDSTVVAHLVATSRVRLPLVYVRMRRWENPDCTSVRDAFLAKYGDRVDYDEYWVDGGMRWWADADAPTKTHAARTKNYFAEAAKRYGPRHITGVRGEESRVRDIAMARWGEAGPGACRPIGRWTAIEVFAYLHKHDLPIHPAYAQSHGGRLDRRWLRVAPIGGIPGSDRGRSEWEASYYPDVIQESQ